MTHARHPVVEAFCLALLDDPAPAAGEKRGAAVLRAAVAG